MKGAYMQTVFEKIIEKLEEEKMSYFLTIANTGDEKLDCAYEQVGDALDKAIEIVKQEAEQYNNGWISCSEQLPEDGMSVLVQDFDEYYEIGICEKRNGVIGITSGDWWTSANNYIAWQPLPQSFHPKGE